MTGRPSDGTNDPSRITGTGPTRSRPGRHSLESSWANVGWKTSTWNAQNLTGTWKTSTPEIPEDHEILRAKQVVFTYVRAFPMMIPGNNSIFLK